MIDLTPFRVIGTYGHMLLIEVDSYKRGASTKHSVEIDIETLVSRCSCEHFEYRIKDNQHLLDGIACKHLAMVRDLYKLTGLNIRRTNNGRYYTVQPGNPGRPDVGGEEAHGDGGPEGITGDTEEPNHLEHGSDDPLS